MKKEKTKQEAADRGGKSLVDHEISRAKRILFRIIMILLPLGLLVLVEIGLRIFNYGGNLNLFVIQKNGAITEYILNKDFTKLYFFQKGIETPIPLSQTFSAEKDSSTYRIFCLGESSVQGFPYQPNASFPAMLKNILATLHPQKNIEVVNCGITAISSFSVLDMSEEIVEKYKPDLLVLYTGHNEFYGVFGSASRLAVLENPNLLRLFLKSQRSRLFLLLRNIINSLFGKDVGEDPSLHRGTMMGIVAKDVGVRLNDDLVRETEDSFKKNIEEIINDAREHHTDIIVCNLVSNIKDFPPFASLHPDKVWVKDLVQWKEISDKAIIFQNRKQYKEAIAAYLVALKIDSMFAETHYNLGQCYYEIRNYDLARKHFELAADLDVIRFRAPSSFNKILKEVCREYSVPFTDVQAEFERLSKNGIIGNNLLHEHVHPNQEGYLQIAKCISKTMSGNGLIERQWDWTKDLSDNSYLTMSHLTPLDKEIVNKVLAVLTSHWPFTSKNRKYFASVGDEKIEQLANSFIKEGKNIVELHIEYGSILQKQNKFDEALAEYEAALAIQPISEVYNRIGLLYLIKTEKAYKDSKDFFAANENYAKGVFYFDKGLARWPDNLELNFNLAMLYLTRNDKSKEAEEKFKKVLELNPSHRNTLTLLSRLYIHLQRTQEAENLLEKAIEYYPQHAGFYTDLGAVLLQENRIQEAKKYLEKAISLDNDLKAKHLIQVLNANSKKSN